MSTKRVTKLQMLSVFLVFNDGLMKAMRRTPEILRDGIMKAAQHWDRKMLPRHFIRGATQRYGYADRGHNYNKRKGNKPALVKTGALQSQMLASAAFIPDKSGVSTRLRGRALNFVPNTADVNAPTVRHSDKRMYPNIKREIKTVTVDERVELSNIVEKHVRRELKKSQKR